MNDVDFKPSGPVRPNTLYTSWRLHKALGYVARKTGRSREDLAEVVLGTWIAQEHPEIEAWLKQREDEESAFQKKLKPIPSSEPAREKQEKFQTTTEDIPH